jgi:hypothetical protein
MILSPPCEQCGRSVPSAGRMDESGVEFDK